MRKFKKFLAAAMSGAMMLGLVATTAPATTVYAEDNGSGSGNTVSGSAITLDYDYMTASFESSDPYVVLEVFKDPTKTDKVSATYTYPTKNGGVTVDLGFYKATKDFGIRMYGSSATTDAEKGGVKPVKKQAEKLSIKVDTSKATFREAVAGKSKEGKGAFTLTDDNIGNYSYRSLYATEWSGLEEFEEVYDIAKIAGTTIVVRKNAVDAPASPEAKVKIAGSAKAPKVTIDYVKGTIKVSNKMEAAKLEGTAPTTFEKLDSNMTIEAFAKKISADEKVGFKAVIRTNDGKKAPSMPCIVNVKAMPSIVANGATATTSGSSITVASVDGGLKLTPTGNDKFQYEKSTDKWVTISGETTIKTSATSVKVRLAPVKEDTKKKIEGAFASNAETITAPAKPAESGSETGGN